jgi:hypothetical protein
MLVRFDHVASIIVNANPGIVRYQAETLCEIQALRVDKLRSTSV